MRDALSKKIVDIEPSGIRKFFDVVSEIPDAISLGVGEPDFDTPWNVREEGIYALEKGRTFYTSNAGLKELRQEISSYVARKYDTQYDPMKQVLVTVGGSEAIDVALRCMVDPGDEVLIPQPSYVSYLPCAVMADAVPVFINLKEENQFKLTKEELLEHITDKTKILIMPFPNNPTGAIMTREELMELVPVIIEKDLYVISDEIYSELTYGDNKPEKTLCLKMYSVGIPASLNMALPSLLISALNVILAAFSQTYVFVLGVYYKLQTFLYLPANGVVQGMRPLIGYNYGAGEHKRVKKIYSTATIIVLIIMCAGTAICLGIPDKLIGLFTTNANTISAGAKALRIISAGFIVSSVSVTASGALEGLGKGLPSLVISVFRYVVIIIPVAFILSRIYEVNGVWWSFGVTELVTAFISYIIYKKATHHH